ncbi:hypothetical protein [Paracraurococcus ruber]|uniref:Uncharacterized protein n=1 Tax=Paracraurococcus ruber TaxID=77675 RepID=A0ABS1CS08_9PROT|nr:hypothetical protein [Paracraurococcus ruber]MBK1657125.1 hypothetical protein [Paracraurococcus ruber]TDG31705.1 hypothetical protein E2C05_09990 [Paracraurococcus ruber]
MTGYRIHVWYDPDGLDRGEPIHDDGVVVLPVIPQIGMEIRDAAGQLAVVRRVVLFATPGKDNAVAAIVCEAGA